MRAIPATLNCVFSSLQKLDWVRFQTSDALNCVTTVVHIAEVLKRMSLKPENSRLSAVDQTKNKVGLSTFGHAFMVAQLVCYW